MREHGVSYAEYPQQLSYFTDNGTSHKVIWRNKMQSTAHAPESSRSLWWNQSIVYWQANQVVITFQPAAPALALNRHEWMKNVISSLNLDILDQFLSAHGFRLKSFSTKDVPRPERTPADDKLLEELEQLEEELERMEALAELLKRVQAPSSWLRNANGEPYKTPGQRDLEELEARIEALEREIEQRERIIGQQDDITQEKTPESGELPVRGLNSSRGKYLFAPPSGQGTLAVCFFHITHPTFVSTTTSYINGKEDSTASDATQALVTLINHNLDTLKQKGNIPILAAMPNWLGGGTPISASCPADPPLPVTGNNTTYSNWHFTICRSWI
jgi:hypothetical protein